MLHALSAPHRRCAARRLKPHAIIATAAILASATFAGSFAAADPIDDPTVVVVATPEDGHPTRALLDADGRIHLLFATPSGPRYSRSSVVTNSDSVPEFAASIPVVAVDPARPDLEYSDGDMALGRDGRVLVTMMTNAWKLKLPQEDWGYHLAERAPGAASFAPVRNVNHRPSEGFSIAADGDGRVVAVWLADRLLGNVSGDDGQTFGPTVEIDRSFNPCNCCTTVTVPCGDGRFAVLYREETGNERDMHIAFWNPATRESSRQRISTTPWRISTCPMTYYDLRPAPGGFVAAWPNGDDYTVHFARLDGDGQLLPPGEVETPGRSWHRHGVAAVPAPDRSTLVVWNKDGRIGWQRYDPQAQPVGATGSAATSGKGVAAVALPDNLFVVFH